MAKKKKELTFTEKLRKIKKAGLEGSPDIRQKTENDPLMPLSERIEQILGIVKRLDKNSNKMIYFVMYDIENNKVRTQVAKYLIKKGCTRVQKSIFLANTNRAVYSEIKNDLKEVQECYENNDSILLVPVSTDEIKAMKIIGQNIDFDLILQNKNTLFF
ncbi:MAG: CRISPR-associated endonuclease Cas2 [Mariniphaga sp.]|nr:CRISPR-associated endonuclease Cas2 [Mariniphaga sp.]